MCHAQKKKVDLLTEAFNEIDKDKSGFLDQSELEEVVKAYINHPDCPAEDKAECSSPAKIKQCCEEFMKKADKSGDKKISLEEFRSCFKCSK